MTLNDWPLRIVLVISDFIMTQYHHENSSFKGTMVTSGRGGPTDFQRLINTDVMILTCVMVLVSLVIFC